VTETAAPERRNGRPARALSLAVALWACMVVRETGLQVQPFLRYMPLWMLLVCLPLALVLQREILGVARRPGAGPAERDIRRCAGFVAGAVIVYAGEFLGAAVSGGWSLRPGFIALLFFYVGILLLLRSGMAELICRLRRTGWGDEAWRRSYGYSDSVLIAAHAALPFFISRLPDYRGAALVLAAAGLRLAWGYVPEDRLSVVREFISFLGERKLWWMAPIFIFLALLMALVMFTQSTGGGFPFIYAVF